MTEPRPLANGAAGANGAANGPANGPTNASAPPVVDDITFRMSARGDAVGFDLECSDGEVRRLVFPIHTLPKLLAGFLWSGAEAAERAPAPKFNDGLRESIEDGARVATAARLVRIEGEDDVVLELEVGAAILAVRLPDTWAETLGVSLLNHVRRNQAS